MRRGLSVILCADIRTPRRRIVPCKIKKLERDIGKLTATPKVLTAPMIGHDAVHGDRAEPGSCVRHGHPGPCRSRYPHRYHCGPRSSMSPRPEPGDQPSLILFRHGNWNEADVIARLTDVFAGLTETETTWSLPGRQSSDPLPAPTARITVQALSLTNRYPSVLFRTAG
jgi:hypothetical protein